jgi:uncharacterized RDD family membrane protein YckC
MGTKLALPAPGSHPPEEAPFPSKEFPSPGMLRRVVATGLDIAVVAVLVFGIILLDRGALQKIYARPSPALKTWMTVHTLNGFGGTSDLLSRNHPDMPEQLKAEYLSKARASTVIIWLLAVVGIWGYLGVGASKGWAIGKRLTGLRVYDGFGNPISIRRGTWRCVMMLFTLFLYACIWVFIWILCYYIVPNRAELVAGRIGLFGLLFLLVSVHTNCRLYDAFSGCVVVRKQK